MLPYAVILDKKNRELNSNCTSAQMTNPIKTMHVKRIDKIYVLYLEGLALFQLIMNTLK